MREIGVMERVRLEPRTYAHIQVHLVFLDLGNPEEAVGWGCFNIGFDKGAQISKPCP